MMQLDAADYPFVREIAAQLPGHDDREQFLAGVDFILVGIARQSAPSAPCLGIS